MAAQSVYGVCARCDFPFSPVHFLDEEHDNHHRLTGRVRKAVSHLVCESWQPDPAQFRSHRV